MDQHQPQDVQPEWQPIEKSIESTALPPPSSGPKRLYRSSDQKIFLGVCGGLGEYFDIDPTLIRLIFAVATLLAGTSIAIYAVLALIMPSEAALDDDPRAAAQATISEASDEVRKGIDLVVGRVSEMFGRNKAEQPPQPPPYQPPPAPPSPPDSHDATTTNLPPSA